MTTAKSLKYVRTTQGFTVFPCLAAIHKDIASVMGWPVRSTGFIDWDFDGRPFCHGHSDSLEIGSLPEDTELLRAEWGMTAPAPVVLSPEAEKAAREFGADLDPVALEQGEPV